MSRKKIEKLRFFRGRFLDRLTYVLAPNIASIPKDSLPKAGWPLFRTDCRLSACIGSCQMILLVHNVQPSLKQAPYHFHRNFGGIFEYPRSNYQSRLSRCQILMTADL